MTRKNHQGVIAFTSPIEFQPLDEVVLGAFERGETPLIVALDGVTDVRNLGAIARTAEVFGATGLLVPMTGSAPINEDAVKSSAGALLRLPMCRAKRMDEALQMTVNLGLSPVAISEKGSQPLSSLDGAVPTCLVLGDEHAWNFRGRLETLHFLRLHPHEGKNRIPQRRRGGGNCFVRISPEVIHPVRARLREMI